MQDKLEDLQYELSIVSGTVNVANTVLGTETVTKEEICLVLEGAVRNLDNSIANVRILVDESIKMCAVLKQL